MVVSVPNNKTSRMENMRNGSQPFGTVRRRGCQRTLWQTTIDKPTLSTPPLRHDESPFELVSAAPVPQVYLDKVPRMMLRRTGQAACLETIAGTNTMPRETGETDQAAARQEVRIKPLGRGRTRLSRREAIEPDKAPPFIRAGSGRQEAA
jgi:hypothetical protein